MPSLSTQRTPHTDTISCEDHKHPLPGCKENSTEKLERPRGHILEAHDRHKALRAQLSVYTEGTQDERSSSGALLKP